MYEDMTYPFLVERMMNRVEENYPNLDNREGSIVFNAVSAAAMELAIMYDAIRNAINESFVETASREFLLLACEQYGLDISIFDATYGVFLGEFNVEIPIGSRWNCDLYNYVVTESIGLNESNYYTYKMQCETKGTAPNNVRGNLTAISSMPTGLTHAEITECIIEGENETSDEEIRTSFWNYMNSVDRDGNVEQYKIWCSEYPGIGRAKIFPLWNGDNTVKVSILSASNSKATEELVQEFQNYLDPGTTGMGDGKAPIGAFVTVSTATEFTINVSANITMKPGYTSTTTLDDAIKNYFSSIAYDKNIASYLGIGSILLFVEGVEYISGLLLNDGTDDIILDSEEIPVLGTTDWKVS